MSQSFEVLCLANSRKHGGRCVAGLRLEDGEWIRPVSSIDGGELSSQHYKTASGHVPRPLNSIRVPVAGHNPKPYKPENWVIADEPWELIDTEFNSSGIEAINLALQEAGELFGNKGKAIPGDKNKNSSPESSLTLIQPENPKFQKLDRDEGPQARANFEFDGVSYDLPITDPQWERVIKSQDSSSVNALRYIEDDQGLLFCISLGEPYEGWCYKLVAGIVPVLSDMFSEFHFPSG